MCLEKVFFTPTAVLIISMQWYSYIRRLMGSTDQADPNCTTSEFHEY